MRSRRVIRTFDCGSRKHNLPSEELEGITV
jgi:hypothetical protein